MRRATIAFMILLCLVSALVLCSYRVHANPHLTCNAEPGADYYSLTIDGSVITSTAQTGGVLYYDLATISTGTHTVTAQACSNLWGCSTASSPFTFSRPALLTAPSGYLLEQ